MFCYKVISPFHLFQFITILELILIPFIRRLINIYNYDSDLEKYFKAGGLIVLTEFIHVE